MAEQWNSPELSVLGPEPAGAGATDDRANAAVQSGWNAGTHTASGVRRIERTTASRPDSNCCRLLVPNDANEDHRIPV